MIQELVLVLDGPEGVVLASRRFGASVFGSRRSLPEGFQIDHSAGHIEAAGRGLVCPDLRIVRSAGRGRLHRCDIAPARMRDECAKGRNRPRQVKRWGVEGVTSRPEDRGLGTCRGGIDAGIGSGPSRDGAGVTRRNRVRMWGPRGKRGPAFAQRKSSGVATVANRPRTMGHDQCESNAETPR